MCWRILAIAVALLAGSLCAQDSAQSVAGVYEGTWSGGSASGTLHVEITRDGGEWKCSVTFTMGDDQYKTKMKSFKVDGTKIEARYEFDLGGTALESTLTGQHKAPEGSKAELEGEYHTVTVSGRSAVDDGRWRAKRGE